ncbi:MAG: carbon-nitrogen family hydrolase [Actinobacteria bacterium]|nr:carbon-nitrogen family hydrolase [Actinomycetota bacterium]
MTVDVALVQLASEETEPPQERVRRAVALTWDAAASADLVVLPELWLAGAFDVHGSGRLAQPVNGELIETFRSVARDTATWIHAGSVPEQDGGFTFNTSVVVAPDGTVAATYRKRHLFGFDGGEPEVMTAGDDLVCVDTPLGPTGLATCYDLRFPEHFRGLVDHGATAFLLASGWPDRRIEHWRVLLRARAIEDQSWVVACNGVGTQCGTTLGGRSAVVDPLGDVVAEAGTDETVLVATVEPTAAADWRAAFPALDDRR